MNKRILPLIMLVMLCFALLQPLWAGAVTPLDPEADASLTLHYQKDDAAFPALQIGIYRVAQAFPDGTFELIAPFAFYPVNIHDISQQAQWKDVATTLLSYITANQVLPDQQAQTDDAGTVRFTGLETGLYLVREVTAENTDGVYLFDAFLVYVPTPQPDGTYEYHVEAKPKCVSFLPKTQYTVTKLWQDDGHQAYRPKEVVVDIYKDAILVETQILSGENDWTYTWVVTGEDPGIWSVTEREVPEGYKVTIRQNGSVFSIINARRTDPEPPPQTGDTFSPLPWILAMCFSGILLLILGIYRRRRK